MINDFIPFFEHWKNLPHQRAAAQQFWEAVPRALKQDDVDWYQTWKAAGKQETTRAITNPLRVPYYSQRDSGTKHALRMCFSSSCAMLLEALKPGTLHGPNGDDTYLGRVFRYGDTTGSEAQVKALADFGIRARFVQNADFQLIEQQIARGIPVPFGYLHRGPISSPSGSGHWSAAIGHTHDAIIVHDPFGELDLLSGTYVNNWGARLSYSRKNLAPRWMPTGPGSGWAIIATAP